MDLQELLGFLRSFWVVWMVLLFAGILAYALWPRNGARFDAASRIPLRDGDAQER